MLSLNWDALNMFWFKIQRLQNVDYCEMQEHTEQPEKKKIILSF